MAVAKDERVNRAKGPDGTRQQAAMNALVDAYEEAGQNPVKGPMGDATASATTRGEADALDTRQRLWDSLSYSYGRQQEESDKAYDQAISQADRQLLSRGMQRSSYGAQTLAGLNNQKINAQRSIQDAMIADYENRLATIDENEAQRAFTRSEREAQQAWQSGENQKNRDWETGENEANRNWQSTEKQKDRDFTTSERIQSQLYQTAERNETQAYNNWQADKDYERRIAASWIQVYLENGGTPSDAMLQQAGISREDFEQMKKKSGGSGSGSRSRGQNKNPGGKDIDKSNITYSQGDFDDSLWS